MAYPAEIRYSPLGLQSRSLTGPLCPVIAPISDQTSSASFSDVDIHCHRRHPPDQPQAKASSPFRAHKPPTNPPRRCPPTSPKRCLLIQSEVDPSLVEPRIVDGDHKMREESVEVDRSVCPANRDEGRHERDVMPASWPTSSASNVMVNCC